MNVKDVDLVKLSRLTSQHIDLTTCLECCKYFIAPKTAACGHSLCHSCWRGRRSCPSCTKPVDRRDLRTNIPLQTLTEHVHVLSETFEKLFNIKLDEFLLDSGEGESLNDPNKNVKEWLASSQNQFSGPVQSSDHSSQDVQLVPNPLEVTSNQIQIHTNTRKTKSPEKVVHVPIPQDDWDKIEVVPDPTGINKNKENVVGPMDIEPFDFVDDQYTVNNPRRSSRKRELKAIDVYSKQNEQNSLEKQSSKDSSGEIDKKSNKTKQNWNSVKRMRKEFSKLNKKNRNKLNVSIEMVKKTQSSARPNVKPHQAPSVVYDIDDNTPDDFNIDRPKNIMDINEHQNDPVEEIPNANISPNCNVTSDVNNEKQMSDQIQEVGKQQVTQSPLDSINHKNNNRESSNIEMEHTNSERVETKKHNAENVVRMPFYKKGALYQNNTHYGETKTAQTTSHNVDTNTTANDDIEITIKVGNTIANIFIKKKDDVVVKVNTDREIQTSLGPQDLNVHKTAPSSHRFDTQSIVINETNKQSIAVNSQPKTDQALNKVSVSVKCPSDTTKKNTDSADTATVQFEITESVEKELSKVMEDVEIDERNKTKSDHDVEEVDSKINTSQKPGSNQDDLDYLNDFDLFGSESVKEHVQSLKNTKHAPSEILVSTVHTKNRTQKHTEKRDRDSENDEKTLPKSKKPKFDEESSTKVKETIEPNKSIRNPTDSEPMNYDSIMGKVFASIDADIEEKHQSQNIDVNTYTLTTNKVTDHDNIQNDNKAKDSQKEIVMSEINNEIECSVNLNEFCNQKDSENIFSVCMDKEEENAEVPSNEKVPPNVPQTNIDEFLTPMMCRNLETAEAMVIDNDIVDDSDKSVVEETPQKSFTKVKQKSNGKNKEGNQSQTTDGPERKVLSEKRSANSNNSQSVIDLADTSKVSSSRDLTVIETVTKPLETPLNISKFVDQITYKSTPLARKSLNFDAENMDDLDPEQTLCPTNDVVAKTTQEKEFLSKAFEKTPTLSAVRPLGRRNIGLGNKKFCIAGTCLTHVELEKLKLLCSRNKWTYTDKYTSDLTHLVVSVDEENKSQRSVKYMCALASSKWIISYEWVEKCLRTKEVIKEEYYEALDSTGEPGPRRSRIASKKLFEGITFFCMEPFSMLDVDTLKLMLEAAGGRVVIEAKEVNVTENTTAPALLLAEPENTQEDKYCYLAMKLSVVPVNYEWALNCLGSYNLTSIRDLLLCPPSLLHKVTETWPQDLLAHDEDP